MKLNTDHFSQCINTLKTSLEYLKKADPNSVEYEIYRNAAIKSFELTLETAGKLLRKALKLYSSNPMEIDNLVFKEVLRSSSKHGLISADSVKRWFKYRDNRNNTAHVYGKALAEATLKLLDPFIEDSCALQKKLDEKLGKQDA